MPEHTGDPRRLGGDIVGDAGPYEEGAVLIDTRNAVLLDTVDVAMMDNPSDRRRFASVMIGGRVNRSTERTRVLYLINADGAAALVSELVALAKREGGDYTAEFGRLLNARLSAMPTPPETGG